jgi:hypothetical protein
MKGLKGALPAGFICSETFPKVFAWMDRFRKVERAAAEKLGKPKTIKGPEALRVSSSSDFAESEGEVDLKEPSGMRKGQEIEVWPIDSGFSNKDRGKLVKLDGKEVVIEKNNKDGKKVRIHAPRHGFRLRAIADSAKL